MKRYSRDIDKIDLIRCSCSFELEVAAIIVGTEGGMYAAFLPSKTVLEACVRECDNCQSHCSQEDFEGT